MNVTFDVGNIYFCGTPPYFFFAENAAALTLILACSLFSRTRENIVRFICASVIGGIGLFLGGKIMGILVEVMKAYSRGQQFSLRGTSTIGFVAYGGIFGYLFFYFLFLRGWQKIFKTSICFSTHADILGVCIPVFHSIARIGCFFAGCCYGVVMNFPITVTYRSPYCTPEPRIPIQLIESMCNAGISAILLYAYSKRIHKGRILEVYLLLYAVCRFVLEQFRGDSIRGVYAGVSTAQIISVSIILVSIIVWGKTVSKNKKGAEE